MTNLKRYGVKLIAAVGRNGAIGHRGGLPWTNVDGDLPFFKSMTTGDVVIAGRRTAQSLPRLPDRIIVSWSRSYTAVIDPDGKIVHELYQKTTPLALMQELVRLYPTKQFWCIGGAETYRAFIAAGLVSKSYISHIDWTGPADTHFPFDAMIGDDLGLKVGKKDVTATGGYDHISTDRSSGRRYAFVQEEIGPEILGILRSGAGEQAFEEIDKTPSLWSELRRHVQSWFGSRPI